MSISTTPEDAKGHGAGPGAAAIGQLVRSTDLMQPVTTNCHTLVSPLHTTGQIGTPDICRGSGLKSSDPSIT